MAYERSVPEDWKTTGALGLPGEAKIPPHMRDAVYMYLKHGIGGGSFLTAVLSNKLVDSYGMADDKNRQALPNWVSWLYWDCPSEAWGSEEKVAAWTARFAEKGDGS